VKPAGNPVFRIGGIAGYGFVFFGEAGADCIVVNLEAVPLNLSMSILIAL
jgi:hypothetical protein